MLLTLRNVPLSFILQEISQESEMYAPMFALLQDGILLTVLATSKNCSAKDNNICMLSTA